MYHITQLYVYPVKSLGGISLETAQLSESGISHDRHWMLVDESGRFISQREIPELSLFKMSVTDGYFTVDYQGEVLRLEVSTTQTEETECVLFDDTLIAIKERKDYSEWFSDQLGQSVNLVRRAPNFRRHVKNHPGSVINFPDGGQYLLLGQGSLDKLNAQLDTPLPINRFRPNIVFSKGPAHAEDDWHKITIGDTHFEITKACGRCKITTVDQESAVVGKEPLSTLSQYRKFGNSVLFGQYLKLVDGTHKTLGVGDVLEVKK